MLILKLTQHPTTWRQLTSDLSKGSFEPFFTITSLFIVSCHLFYPYLFPPIANCVCLDEQINSLDLYVGNSTDLTQAVHCDRTDHHHFYTHRITLWCLEPTFGRYIIIRRDICSTPSVYRISEVEIF